MINSRKKIIILLSSLAVLFIIILGISYAYYATEVNGNASTDPSLTLKSGYLKITYIDGQEFIPANQDGTIEAGKAYAKTFKVRNNGIKEAYYEIWLKDVINPFVRTQDWTYSIAIDGVTIIENVQIPTMDSEILSARSLAVDAEEEITLYVTYANSTEDQTVDMNKSLEFYVSVVQSNVA